jgi:hypothetical protein
MLTKLVARPPRQPHGRGPAASASAQASAFAENKMTAQIGQLCACIRRTPRTFLAVQIGGSRVLRLWLRMVGLRPAGGAPLAVAVTGRRQRCRRRRCRWRAGPGMRGRGRSA